MFTSCRVTMYFRMIKKFASLCLIPVFPKLVWESLFKAISISYNTQMCIYTCHMHAYTYFEKLGILALDALPENSSNILRTDSSFISKDNF